MDAGFEVTVFTGGADDVVFVVATGAMEPDVEVKVGEVDTGLDVAVVDDCEEQEQDTGNIIIDRTINPIKEADKAKLFSFQSISFLASNIWFGNSVIACFFYYTTIAQN